MRNDGAAGRPFRRWSLPRPGEKVEVLCRHDSVVTPAPFLCSWTAEDGWVICGTRRKVEAEVLGWRRR